MKTSSDGELIELDDDDDADAAEEEDEEDAAAAARRAAGPFKPRCGPMSDALRRGHVSFALARIVTSDPCGASATNRSTAVFALAFHPANNIFIGARVAAAAFTPAADVSNASMCSLWLPLGGHPLASALVTSRFEL